MEVAALVSRVTLALAAVVGGLATLAYLTRRRRWWLLRTLLLAFVAILYVIYTDFPSDEGEAVSEGLLYVSLAVSIFAHMIVVIGVVTRNMRKESSRPSILVDTLFPFIIFMGALPALALTAGVLLASTLVTILRRPFGWGRGSREIGSRTFSHLFYYGTVICLFVEPIFCGDPGLFHSTLNAAFVLTCAGTVGVVYETERL